MSSTKMCSCINVTPSCAASRGPRAVAMDMLASPIVPHDRIGKSMTGDFLVLVIVALASGELAGAPERDGKEVAAIARGDQAALGRVYDRYHRLVYSLAVRVLGDHSGAEERSPDVLLRLWP